MVAKETSSLGFDVQNLKISAGFCNILTGLLRGMLLFEFGEILAFILFQFGSDLLGETFLPNGLTKISWNSVCLI